MTAMKLCPKCGKPAILEVAVDVAPFKEGSAITAVSRLRCEGCGMATKEVMTNGARVKVHNRKAGEEHCFGFLR